MSAHVRKLIHVDPERTMMRGPDVVPLETVEFWCGHTELPGQQWAFLDAQHVLLAMMRSAPVEPCADCLRAMRAVLEAELA